MKALLLLASASLLSVSLPAQPALVKKWEVEGLKSPESALVDTENKVIYVANIGGTMPWEKDGNGSISKVSLDGKLIALDWVTGFDSAKGMGILKGKLYVADIERVGVIDLESGKLEKMIPVPGAQRLNDLTISKEGVVYVSDSGGKKVFAVKGETVDVYLDEKAGLAGPNGLLAVGSDLYVLDSAKVQKVGPNRSLVVVAEGLEAGLDGIEEVKAGEFIVTSARGVIYHVTSAGVHQILLDTRADKIQTADLAYDAKSKLLYVPTLFTHKLLCFELQ